MDLRIVSRIIESLLLVADEPITAEHLVNLFDGQMDKKAIKEAMENILLNYQDHALQVIEVAHGYKLCTRPEYAEWIKRFLREERRRTLSRAALETLAIICYRQPITRPEVEEIRGVDISGVLKSLLDKGLIKVMGRKDVPGRPMVYGTTKKFLEHFGLNSLSDLPPLEEFQKTVKEENEGMETAGEINSSL